MHATDGISSRMRELRKALGLTQAEFAYRIDRDASYLSRIEKGNGYISDKCLESVCDVFNVNYEWLFSGKGNMFAGSVETAVHQEEADLDEAVDEVLLTDELISWLRKKPQIVKDLIRQMHRDLAPHITAGADEPYARMRELRTFLQLNKVQMARRIGVTTNYLNDIERGRRALSEQMINAVCAEFDVSADWLYKGENPVFTHSELTGEQLRIKNMAERVKNARKKLKLTRNQLAERSGVSAEQIAALEEGSAEPDDGLIAKLTDILQIGGE